MLNLSCRPPYICKYLLQNIAWTLDDLGSKCHQYLHNRYLYMPSKLKKYWLCKWQYWNLAIFWVRHICMYLPLHSGVSMLQSTMATVRSGPSFLLKLLAKSCKTDCNPWHPEHLTKDCKNRRTNFYFGTNGNMSYSHHAFTLSEYSPCCVK